MIPWTFEHNLVHKTTEGETTASAELQHWLSQFPVLISKAKSKTGCQREENNVYFIDSPSILPMFCPHLQPPLPAPAGLHDWDEPGGEGRVCRAQGKVAPGKPAAQQGAPGVTAQPGSVLLCNIHSEVPAVGQKDNLGITFPVSLPSFRTV